MPLHFGVGLKARRGDIRRREGAQGNGEKRKNGDVRSPLLFREFFFEFVGELVDVGGFAESLDLLGCRFHVHAGVLTEPLQHLEHQFLLGEHADLKIEMTAPLGLASHAVLTDQHLDGEEHALGCDKERQDVEGERIERLHAGKQVEILGHPDENQNPLEDQGFYAADEFYDGIAIALGTRAAMQSFLFQLGDGGNIELRRIFRNLVRHFVFHAGNSGSSRIEAHTLDRQAI